MKKLAVSCWLLAVSVTMATGVARAAGTSGEPWEIGTPNATDVMAWMDDVGKLTIAGTGAMNDFPSGKTPWYSVRDSITMLEIKPGVTTIGSHAFAGCSGLTSVTIPSGVTTIGNFAFSSCSGLTSVTISSGVTTIGDYAFYVCRGLTSVTIPSSVTSIGRLAFSGCPLTRVIAMREVPPTLGAYAFGNYPKFAGMIFVPNDCELGYEAADGWKNYAGAMWEIVLVTLPPGVGYRYVVRDLSLGGAVIEPTEAGGTTYALPRKEKISIDVVPEPGYAVIGESYVIDWVDWDTTIDESLLPRVAPLGSELSPWTVGSPNADDVKAWTNGTGMLTVEGTGGMMDFPTADDQPWASVRASITSLELDSSVTCIGRNAFAGCALTRVIEMREEPPPLGSGAFGLASEFTGTILVPYPSVDDYKTEDGWEDYADFIGPIDEVKVTVTPGTGCGYAVSNLSDAVAQEIAPTVAGGTTYVLPLGAKVGIYAVPEPGYAAVGGPYVIDEVEWDTTIDEDLLPRVAPLGSKLNPWKIGTPNAADVRAWMDGTGKLTVEGTGVMMGFPTADDQPWASVRTSITSLEIASGVRSISRNAFAGCALTRVDEWAEKPPELGPLAFVPPSEFAGTIFVPGPYVDDYRMAVGWKDYADHIQARTEVEINLEEDRCYHYVVSNLSDNAVIRPRGTTYALPIGKKVGIYVEIDPRGVGYVVVGEPCIIDEVKWNTTIDESRLPQAVPPGGELNPWQVGLTSDEDDVRAWTNGTGKLIVEGTGRMKDFGLDYDNPEPWSPYDISDPITSIEIRSGVTCVGNSAFNACFRATRVTIPSSVTRIGKGAFSAGVVSELFIEDLLAWCNTALEDSGSHPFGRSSSGTRRRLFVNGEEVTDLVVPAEVTKIGPYAFAGCNGLTSVTIPSGVTTVGDSAFFRCRGLTSVTIPSGVTVIGHAAFYECSGLTSVTIPSSVTSINYAFVGCSGISSLYIESLADWCGVALGHPGAHPFGASEAATRRLFVNGEEVTDIVIPSDVTMIGSYAFCNCNGLRSVTIPSGETRIGKRAFYGCSGLRSVIEMAETRPQIGFQAFGWEPSSEMSIFVPPEAVEAYKTAGGHWEIYSDRIRGFDWVGEGACVAEVDGVCVVSGTGVATNLPPAFDRGSITTAVVGDGVTGIGEAFFFKCNRLNEVTLGKDVATLEDNAFLFCLGLEKVEIKNPDFDTKGLESTIHYHTAIRPDGSLYTIPSVSIAGYEEVLYGTVDLAEPVWKEIPTGTKMEESGYHFFKFVLRKIVE